MNQPLYPWLGMGGTAYKMSNAKTRKKLKKQFMTNEEKRHEIKRKFLRKNPNSTEITAKEWVVLAVIGAIGLGVMWFMFYLIFSLGILFL